jgi:hypothetical protein
MTSDLTPTDVAAIKRRANAFVQWTKLLAKLATTPADGSRPHVETSATLRDVAVAIGAHHREDSHGDGPHNLYLHEGSGAVHHEHHPDANPDHLAQMRADLERIPNVGEVTQSDGPPEGRGWQHIYEGRGGDDDDDQGDEAHGKSGASKCGGHSDCCNFAPNYGCFVTATGQVECRRDGTSIVFENEARFQRFVRMADPRDVTYWASAEADVKRW